MSDVNVTEKVREALRQNLCDTTGDCVCDPAYTERELIDPHCGWHEAEGTTDDDSVARVLSALSDPEVLAGIAGVLREHGDSRQSASGLLLVCRCGDFVDDHAAHQAAALVEWLRGQG